MNDDRWPMADDRWPMADGRWPMADSRYPITQGRGRRGGSWQLETGNWQLATGNWQLETGNYNVGVVSIARQLTRSLTGRWLNVLLVVAPVSWWMAIRGDTSLWLFVAAAISLIPAAGLIGEATEELANRSGPTLGGFLNATFGNAAELIIAIVALRAHHIDIVQASITGSIIGNLLLVFGASCFAGGLKHGTQKFNRTAAGSATVMLALAVAALVMPATVDLFAFGSLDARPEVLQRLSVWTSWVLLGVYGAGLVF